MNSRAFNKLQDEQEFVLLDKVVFVKRLKIVKGDLSMFAIHLMIDLESKMSSSRDTLWLYEMNAYKNLLLIEVKGRNF